MAVKILAADDSATMRLVLEMTFAGEAVEMTMVESGEAAVESAIQSPPDLMIVDASMSMSGYDVAQAIKRNAATASVAVIVLASQHNPFDSGKAKDCGVDDHILKPYDSQAMIDKAKEVLSRPRAKASAAAAAPAPPARPAPPAPPARPSPPRAPSAGRPASRSSNANPRATVAFGSVKPAAEERPVLQLAEDDKAAPAATAAPATTAAPAAAVAPKRTAPKAPGLRTPEKPARAAAKPAARPTGAAAAATAAGGSMAGKLGDLGLTKEQIEGVLGLSRDVIERVVWEVVPELAEMLIKEEIRRLTAE